ncbi:hypothetical protein [Flavobacterium sp. 140616W15]|uniref:hypothetical protein n=1 Tax=Flavobacterium sp. 140616W15 TaxID=2478552 RepID=UPI000F0C00F9|nr:hypothetical protein [Flavobacterium sp. 140616W15]AYN03973.1 hypothetical protein EAG11_07030 [Flavobacterium sp. 140616W15]
MLLLIGYIQNLWLLENTAVHRFYIKILLNTYLGISALPSLIKEEFTFHPLNAIITILQSIAQVFATILLFSKDKLKD